MKLNTKRTVFVGFAFFLICAFWQAYDTIIPKILTDKFGLPQTISGIVMALDNILALFLLPIFGAISDKHAGKHGKRTPFIVIGTLIAAVLLVSVSLPDNAQAKKLGNVGAVEGAAYEEVLDTLWEADPTFTVRGESKPLSGFLTEEEFKSIKALDADGETTADYTDYVIPARQAYARTVTLENPAPLVAFAALLLGILVAMGTFRSPAVALMPDVTVKPLRSKANAIINLMGTAGGIVILLLGIVFSTGKIRNALMSYTTFFAVVAAVMLVSLGLFLWRVREVDWAREMREDSVKYGIEETADESGDRRLSRGEFVSLILILASVVLWFMGYNAVTSKYSVYAGSVLNKDYNTTLLIANGAAIVSYIPIGFISSRFGRKKTILAGIVILAASFFSAAFLRSGSPTMLMNVLFALAGIGWATINVNSYPMVVELSRGGNVGKYTGYYYTASMAAQVVTPVLSGVFMDKISMTTLFPYATVFVALAFLTMFFVRHGDSKPEAKATALDAMGGND